MRQAFIVAAFTFKESMARKTFIAFFAISTITLLILLFAMNIEVVDGALATLSLFGKSAQDVRINVEKFLLSIQMVLATALFTAGIFLSVFATAGLVPNMLEKGNIDWILARPISRFQLLLGRYLGGVSIVSFNILYLIVGSWLILSFKTGYWQPQFVYASILIILPFAVLFAVMVFLGVAFQNSAISIMGAYLMIFFSPMLYQREKAYALLSKKIYQLILDGLYYLSAPIFETGEIMKRIIFHEAVTDWQPLVHLVLLAPGYFALATWLFYRKDF